MRTVELTIFSKIKYYSSIVELVYVSENFLQDNTNGESAIRSGNNFKLIVCIGESGGGR